MAELQQLEASRKEALFRAKSGRELVCTGVRQQSVHDRYIGQLELFRGSNRAHYASDRIDLIGAKVAELKAELLRKHREKEQIRVLIRIQLEREKQELLRRLQLQLDEWARSIWSDESAKGALQFDPALFRPTDRVADETEASETPDAF